jgi:hypothetical protein
MIWSTAVRLKVEQIQLLMARHYHRSPELITDQEVQAYLLHLVRDRQLARTNVNQACSAVRFLACELLGQADRARAFPWR